MKIAVVGATGLIGKEIIREIIISLGHDVEIKALASERSAGEILVVEGREFIVQVLSQDSFDNCQYAFFSAGGKVSEKFVPYAMQSGAFVIDNTSHFRMHSDVPLVAASLNDDVIADSKLVSNPNCSTIQLVHVINLLREISKVIAINVVSMQSISGAGQQALNRLKDATLHALLTDQYHHLAFDCETHIDQWMDNDYCKEEWKIANELPKILNENIPLQATTIRIPVLYGHTQSVTVDFNVEIDRDQIEQVLHQSDLITYHNPREKLTPMQQAKGNSKIHVGRLRAMSPRSKVWNFMVLSDNILRGGASNAVEIMMNLEKLTHGQ
tara:strand:+ start:497 stop:1474 length:978 start_codon:yes stop_codon:yes gene_type:complete